MQMLLMNIIILIEIWIYENEIGMFSIDSYINYFSCNNDSRSGGIARAAQRGGMLGTFPRGPQALIPARGPYNRKKLDDLY